MDWVVARLHGERSVRQAFAAVEDSGSVRFQPAFHDAVVIRFAWQEHAMILAVAGLTSMGGENPGHGFRPFWFELVRSPDWAGQQLNALLAVLARGFNRKAGHPLDGMTVHVSLGSLGGCGRQSFHCNDIPPARTRALGELISVISGVVNHRPSRELLDPLGAYL